MKDCTALVSAIVYQKANANYDYSLFNSGKSLTSVTIKDSFIGSSAFAGCTSLTDVNMVNCSGRIERAAFNGCTSLADITICEGITEIRLYAFQNCTSLTNVSIPDTVTYIDNVAFSNCTSLTSITIPSSVTYIGTSGNAFEGCSKIKTIIINKPKDSIEGSPWGAYNATIIWTG